MDEQTQKTYEVAKKWFDSIGAGKIEDAISCLADDVEWVNYIPVPGLKEIMPWTGTYYGPEAVFESFKVFTSLVEPQNEELLQLAVLGEEAAGVVHEISVVKATGLPFEIEFIHWLTVKNGKIVKWRSYTDPSPIIMAFQGKSPYV